MFYSVSLLSQALLAHGSHAQPSVLLGNGKRSVGMVKSFSKKFSPSSGVNVLYVLVPLLDSKLLGYIMHGTTALKVPQDLVAPSLLDFKCGRTTLIMRTLLYLS